MYVIAGVTGRTGGVAADQLLNAGKSVRVIVRDASRARAWRDRGAQVAVASLDDADALARALEGATGAYLLYPASLTSADPLGEGWRTADAIARAVDRSGLPHLVFLSALGASQAEGTGMIRSLHAAEVRLRASRANLSIIRATYFLDEWLPVLGAAADGQLPTFLLPDRVVPLVASRDIGALVARTLIEGPAAGGRQVLRLRGPRDFSPRDLADQITQSLGRAVTPAFAPDAAVVPTLTSFGASPAFAEQVRLMYRWINETDAFDTETEGPLVRGSTEPMQVFRPALAAASRRREQPDQAMGPLV
jgi:uncharacterized protein YbjT (DUF2867 family)